MSSYVDHEARTDSFKALTVIFIILIASASLILLIKIATKRNAVYNVRRCMVIVLTLGVLLYSLFTLVVSARMIFGDYQDITCMSHFTSTTYGLYFLPFVYSFGLIVMALEIFMARNGKTPSAVVQFVYISVPWLLALVVVLPLTMSGIDLDNCMYYITPDRQKAHIWFCCLLPPVGAVAAYILLVVMLKSNSNGAVPSSGNTQGTTNAPALSVSVVCKQATYNTVSPSGVVLASGPPSQPQQQFSPGCYPPHDYHSGSIPSPYQAIMAQNPPQYQHQYPGPGIPAQYPNYHHQQHQHYYPSPPNCTPPPPGFGPSYYDTNAPAAQYQTQPQAAPYQAQPQAAPYQAQPQAGPYQAQPKAALCQAQPQAAPHQAQPQAAPCQSQPQAAPCQAQPQAAPYQGQPQAASYQAQPQAAPYQAQPQAAPQPVFTITAPPRDLRSETNALGLVSIVFFLCSFPFAVFTLFYTLNENAARKDPVPKVIANDTIYWVTVLRYFLLLLIFWFKFM